MKNKEFIYKVFYVLITLIWSFLVFGIGHDLGKSKSVIKPIEFNRVITEDSTYITFDVNGKKLLVVTGNYGTQILELK